MKVLLVEDDESLAMLLKASLKRQHYTVDVATDGQTGWDLAETMEYDLIVLDVELPRLDGVSFCRKLRAQGYPALVLLLTARGTSHDKVIGLDAGADDYVVKPVPFQELEARMRALLRRKMSPESLVLTWGNLKLDPSSCTVTYGDAPLTLTAKEYALLELFLRNPQRIFSPRVILDRLWTSDHDAPGEETVRAHIKRLRQKLKPVGAEQLIETMYGLGYRLSAGMRTGSHLSTTAASTAPADIPPSPSISLADMASLWTRHKAQVMNRLGVLEQAVQEAGRGQLSVDLQERARRECHSLIGALGMVGMTQGSAIARQLETLFQGTLLLNTVQQEALSGQVAALRHCLDQTPMSVVQSALEPSHPQPPVSHAVAPAIAPCPRLLIVHDDQTFADQMLKESPGFGLDAAIALQPALAQDAIQRIRPDIVLLDLSNPADSPDGLRLLETLAQQHPPIPALVVVGDCSPHRAAIARRRGRIMLKKPLVPTEVLAIVAQTLTSTKPVEAKILAIDDDPIILRLLKAVLEPWGLQITTSHTPLQFWDDLAMINPDLLILDVEMPDLNGIELCQMLRDNPRWAWLPIVFLTGYRDSDTIQQLFSAGADDYISKPIIAAELITRVLNRLERTHLLRQCTETDTLTGLPNQQQSSHAIDQFLKLAQQSHQPFCVCVVEIDHLRQINRQYGHPLSDRLLRQFAQQLRQSMQPDDLVSRWDGTEFMIWLHGITHQNSVAWLTEMLELFSAGVLILPNGDPVPITFSAGVAQYPDDGTHLQALYQSAANALDQAKQSGGNRVCTQAS